MKKLFLFLLLIIISTTSYAGVIEGLVTNFYVGQTGLVMLRVEDSNGNTPSDCRGGLWPFTFSPTSTTKKEWISMILTARTTQEEIHVQYTSTGSNNVCVATVFAFY